MMPLQLFGLLTIMVNSKPVYICIVFYNTNIEQGSSVKKVINSLNNSNDEPCFYFLHIENSGKILIPQPQHKFRFYGASLVFVVNSTKMPFLRNCFIMPRRGYIFVEKYLFISEKPRRGDI